MQVFRIPTQQTMTPLLPDADVTEALLQSYGASRQRAGDQVCIVALHIGGQNSGIALGRGLQPELVKSLPLGAECTAREQFRTAPPTPLAWLLSPKAWTAQTGWYLAYRVADYVVMNLGEDAAMVALVFC